MAEEMKKHQRRVKKEHEERLHHDPKAASKVKLEKITALLPTTNSFKSPSRNDLLDREMKEALKVPNAAYYHPRIHFTMKTEARPASLPVLQENQGKIKKRQIFEK